MRDQEAEKGNSDVIRDEDIMDGSAALVPSLPLSEVHRINTVPPISPEDENTFSPCACSPNRRVKDSADDVR